MGLDEGRELSFELNDPELLEHLSSWSQALSSVSERWKFRAKAGRLGSHSQAEVIRLVSRLDTAAHYLEVDPRSDPRLPEAAVGEAMARSEERFRILVDSVHDYAVVMLDSEGRVVSWNPGAERIYGHRAEEIIGRPFHELYPPEGVRQKVPGSELSVALEQGRHQGEGWGLRKNGTQFWAGVTLTALRAADDALRGFGLVVRDLTERAKVEATLRESEERFRLLVEGVQDYAILMLDPQGRVTSWNSGAERLKGYRADEVIGRHFSIFATPEAVAAGLPEMELEQTRKNGRHHDEGWRVRKDGSRYWASVILTALRDERGELRGFAKVTRDFTERKRVDDEIRALNSELEQRVRDRTAALEAINKELEAFSYSVSHDLRAPLRGIDGFGKIVLERYGPALDEQGRHYLQRIRAGTQRMGRLIDDLLRLSKLSRAELKWAPLDLSEMAKEVIAELSKVEPERQVKLVVSESLSARGDAQLLQVVLENLLGNAWKFTRKTQDARIEVGRETCANEECFFVRDNGAGFDMEYAGKLFAPFQRLHDMTEFEGTGIGLATVQRIIARHGGRIWAEARPDHGATFWFTLKEQA